MIDTKMTRLGDILLEKGLLSGSQLQEAILEQKRRRERIDPNDKLAFEATSLGEVLIDLGYINRQQLRRGLNWQMYIRNMTLVMSLCAPLMTIATGAAASTTSSSRSSVISQELPATVQAEDYTTMLGIRTEPTTDVGGGANVGYIHAGDWISYEGKPINIPVTGKYKVTFRVASPGGGGSFSFHEANGGPQHAMVMVPNTGGSQQWVDVEQTISLSAGEHKFGITALVRGAGYNINWFKVEYIGQPLPVTIQAEDYSSMLGIRTETTTDVGGGTNVAYIHAGDWLAYANTLVNIPATGSYRVTYRLASPGGGGSFSLQEADGSAQYDTVAVPNTGSSQTWVDVVRTVSLTKGVHKFGINALVRGAGFNINWFKIEDLADVAAVPPGVASSSAPASQATSSKATSSQATSSKAASSQAISSKAISSKAASSLAASSKPASAAKSSSSAASTQAASSAPSITGSSSSDGGTNQSASSSPSADGEANHAVQVLGSVQLQWNIPTRRVNGDPLYDYELGGYEVRYRKLPATEFTYVTIEAWKSEYIFTWLEGAYEFEIAAFDNNGLYSQFIPLKPRT